VNPYLARSLVEGLRNTVIVEDDRIRDLVPIDQTPFERSLSRGRSMRRIGQKRLGRRQPGREP